MARADQGIAAERVTASATSAEIARELSANESLIGRWVRDSREDKPGRRAKTEPASGMVKVIGVYDPPKPSAEAGSCTIQVDDIQLTIGPEYPAAHLTEILRAVRASE